MNLIDDIDKAKDLAPRVVLGLIHEICTDPDMAVLAVAALLRETRFKGASKALSTYFMMRQIGHFVVVIASKADKLAQVIGDDRSRE